MSFLTQYFCPFCVIPYAMGAGAPTKGILKGENRDFPPCAQAQAYCVQNEQCLLCWYND